jgi:hypothetical protein
VGQPQRDCGRIVYFEGENLLIQHKVSSWCSSVFVPEKGVAVWIAAAEGAPMGGGGGIVVG